MFSVSGQLSTTLRQFRLFHLFQTFSFSRKEIFVFPTILFHLFSIAFMLLKILQFLIFTLNLLLSVIDSCSVCISSVFPLFPVFLPYMFMYVGMHQFCYSIFIDCLRPKVTIKDYSSLSDLIGYFRT